MADKKRRWKDSRSLWKRLSPIKIVGIVLLLSSSILFGAYVPINIDGDIEKKQKRVIELSYEMDLMMFSYAEFQSWETRAAAVRAEITSLWLSNIYYQYEEIQSLIEDREVELLSIKLNALSQVTATLEVPEEVEEGWSDLSHDEREQEKKVWVQELQDKHYLIKDELSDLKAEIAVLKTRKSLIINITLIIHTLGTLLTSFSKDKTTARARVLE